jgi:hypothetical protein
MLPRSSVSTIVGVAITAYALRDLVHEVLGHGLAASMTRASSSYPLYSAVLRTGDWHVVIQGLQPSWLWRVGLGGVGVRPMPEPSRFLRER